MQTDGVQTNGRKTADVMERAASELLSVSGSAGESIQRAGDELAESIKRLAGYMREHEISDLVDDLRKYGQYIQEHPGRAIIAAVVAGFLVYRLSTLNRS